MLCNMKGVTIAEIIEGILSFLTPAALPFIFGAIIIGLILGILPGIGGMVTLALMLPFVYGMDAKLGLSILLAAHAVTATGGSVSAILVNIPGTNVNAATLIDGFPMTQKGEGNRAVGAGLTSSMLGGIFGGLILALLIPVMYPIALAFGAPEIFVLVIIGISFIGMLGTGSMIKGLIAGFLGILLSFIGWGQVTGTARFTFGTMSLLDGFHIIPIALGFFALPEVIEMMKTGGSLAKVDLNKYLQRGWITRGTVQGITDVFRHWWLFLRGSIIGTVIGIVPGVGGETAPFIAWGHAKQFSKHPEQFGKGCIEGVIAPESANNAKEGGSLVPTISFGVPGSASMAILLGGFLILGLEPGPLMLRYHIDIVWSLVGVLIFANVIGAIICIFFAGQLSRISFIRGHLLAPLVLVLCVIGTFSVHSDLIDVIWMFMFGTLGYAMKVFGYPRPAMLLGFVLGSIAEIYFHIALKAYGPLFFIRPITLVLIFFLFASIGFESFNRYRKKRRAAT